MVDVGRMLVAVSSSAIVSHTHQLTLVLYYNLPYFAIASRRLPDSTIQTE